MPLRERVGVQHADPGRVQAEDVPLDHAVADGLGRPELALLRDLHHADLRRGVVVGVAVDVQEPGRGERHLVGPRVAPLAARFIDGVQVLAAVQVGRAQPEPGRAADRRGEEHDVPLRIDPQHVPHFHVPDGVVPTSGADLVGGERAELLAVR